MTQTSAFHFESLVWDWPIAIYLFLIGISAGLVTLAVLLRRFYPQAGGADSTLLRTTLIVGPGAVILGLLSLVFHLTRPWTFWKLMFHYSFTSVMSMGVMLFQLYMVVLVLWLAKIFEHDLLALQQRWLPKLGIVQKVLSLLTPVHRGLETLMLVLAVLLGAYTGFLLSALKSYPFLNNPILPVLFLFSGISSGAAVALIAMAIRQRSNPHSTEAQFVHRMEIPVVWGEIFLLAAFFVGLALGVTWLECINCGDHPRFLVGLLRTRLGRLVVLGSGGKRLFITLAFCHCAAAQFIPDTPAGDFSPLVAVVGDSYSDAVAAGHLNCPFWHSGFGSCVRSG